MAVGKETCDPLQKKRKNMELSIKAREVLRILLRCNGPNCRKIDRTVLLLHYIPHWHLLKSQE